MLYGVPRMMKLSAALAPHLAQPLEVRLEPAGGEHQRPGRASSAVAAAGRGRVAAVEPAVARGRARRPRRRTPRRMPSALGGGVVAVHQRLAAAEEERVGAPQVQRAAQRRLEAHAELPHPRRDSRPSGDDQQPRERLVGLAAGDAQQVGEELVLRVRRRSGRRSARRARSGGCGCAGCCRRGNGAARTRATITLAPASRAVSAAHRPALPPPSTTTS